MKLVVIDEVCPPPARRVAGGRGRAPVRAMLSALLVLAGCGASSTPDAGANTDVTASPVDASAPSDAPGNARDAAADVPAPLDAGGADAGGADAGRPDAGGADAGGGTIPQGAATYRIQPGGVTTIAPGSQAGYGITANTGSVFRLVWTGNGGAGMSFRAFRGSVYTTGTFSRLAPGCAGEICPLASGDSVSAPITIPGGQRIDFSAGPTPGVAGFDFVTSAEPVYFELFVDGVARPEVVVFPDGSTGNAATPGENPFGLISIGGSGF
ncbi:MAG: hypothetical protein U0325_00560 [Polyangiales bacterium]